MKTAINIFQIFLFILLSSSSKSQNKEPVVLLEAAYTSDFSNNLKRGVVQRSVFLGNIDLKITFDTEKAKLWKGGSFFFYGLNNHGKSISNVVGNLQVTSNIEAKSSTRLYQFWYSHLLGNLELTLGQHDLNSEFAITDFGSSLINSSFGIQPDISNNVTASIFPMATLGVVSKWNISKKLNFLAAIYDGNPGEEMENPNSVKWKINAKEGVMYIFELQLKAKRDSITRGNFKIGGWHHSANTFSNDQTIGHKNVRGTYFIADYQFFREKSTKPQGLGAFLQIGMTSKNCNHIRSYIGAGLLYHGLIYNRDNDDIGIAIGNAFLGNIVNTTNQPKYETIVEVTYKAILNSHFTVQPDVQYIINPVGLGDSKNALVSTLRLKFEF